MKNKLIFLDTEATGNDVKKDRLCQICYKLNGNISVKNFKPPLPISVKAMSITHITNKMVDGEEPFKDSQIFKDLNKLLEENILVAHNAKFDIALLEAEGLKIKKHICTLRVARYLDDRQEIPEYNLQFLRYYYDVEVEARPHSADGDVITLEAVFDHLYKNAKEKSKIDSDEEIIKRMINISACPVLIKKFNFGKYLGKFVGDVVKDDRGYLEWLLRQKEQTGEDEDWIFTLKHYLGR